MALDRKPRPEKAPVWVDGTDLTPAELRRDAAVTHHNIRVRGQVHIATAAGLAIQGEGILEILKLIEVRGVSYGKDVPLKRFSGAICYRLAQWLHGTTGYVSDGGLAAGGGATGSYNFEANFQVDWRAPGHMDPFPDLSTLLTWQYSQLLLQITTADPSDIVVPDTTTVTLFRRYGSSAGAGVADGVPTIEVSAMVAKDIDPRNALMSRYTEVSKFVDVTAAGTDLTANAKLDPGGLLVRAFQRVTTEDAVTGTALSDTLIANLRLEAGDEELHNSNWSIAQRRMKQELGIETIPAGYNAFLFTPDGDVRTGFDTRQLAAEGLQLDLQTHIDSNGTAVSGTMEMLQQRYLPPVGSR